MDCRSARNKLDRYVAKELSPRLGLAVSRHLAECPACAREAERRNAIRLRLGAAKASMPDFEEEDSTFWPQVRARIRRDRFRAVGGFKRFVLPAASVAAAVLVAVAILWSARAPDPDAPSSAVAQRESESRDAQLSPSPSEPDRTAREAAPQVFEVRTVGIGEPRGRGVESYPLRQSYRVHQEDDVVEF